MYTFLTILAIIVCIFLVLIVLVQNPKGGGLASNFAGSNQVMGVKKTGDFLEKTTWGLAIALLSICLILNIGGPAEEEDAVENSALQEQLDNAETQQGQQPVAPTPAAPIDTAN